MVEPVGKNAPATGLVIRQLGGKLPFTCPNVPNKSPALGAPAPIAPMSVPGSVGGVAGVIQRAALSRRVTRAVRREHLRNSRHTIPDVAFFHRIRKRDALREFHVGLDVMRAEARLPDGFAGDSSGGIARPVSGAGIEERVVIEVPDAAVDRLHKRDHGVRAVTGKYIGDRIVAHAGHRAALRHVDRRRRPIQQRAAAIECVVEDADILTVLVHPDAFVHIAVAGGVDENIVMDQRVVADRADPVVAAVDDQIVAKFAGHILHRPRAAADDVVFNQQSRALLKDEVEPLAPFTKNCECYSCRARWRAGSGTD